MEQQVLAKGVNFLYAKRFIISSYGNETWKKVVRFLPRETRDIWDGALLVNSTYPFAAFKAMTTELMSVLNSPKDSEIAKIYEFIADQSLNKIYKIFFRYANPSFVIRNYPKLWDKFFNSGNVEVPAAENGHAVLKFSLPEIFIDWLRPACLGYSKKAVEMAGGKDLRIRELRRDHVSQKLWVIEYELNWKE